MTQVGTPQAARTPNDARADLVSALERGLDLRLPRVPTTQHPRHSAVLILFGELDQVLAAPTPTPSTMPATLDVLLTKRADHLRHHPGQVAFPGGGVEPGDRSRAHTALREAQEETGLNPHGVDVLGTLNEIWLEASHNLVTPVIGWWRGYGLPRAISR